MAIFNSYVSLPEGNPYPRGDSQTCLMKFFLASNSERNRRRWSTTNDMAMSF